MPDKPKRRAVDACPVTYCPKREWCSRMHCIPGSRLTNGAWNCIKFAEPKSIQPPVPELDL